jgi:phenylacetic acid degradation operon negative regulatory protein
MTRASSTGAADAGGAAFVAEPRTHPADAAPATAELLEDHRLPRSQVGTTPQHLVMTLLGDYWFGRMEQLPSAALVGLLAEFDISEPSTRAALNRLTKRGLLMSSKRGRNTYYGLHTRAIPLLRDGAKQIAVFGAPEARPWDGMWTVVAFSVPEVERWLRHGVRTKLRWLGFAALYAEIDERSTVQALSAWDLEALKREYLEFGEEFSPILDKARRGALTASQALVERTKVMDRWRNFLGAEPDLPTELLPGNWPRSRMRRLFFELYDSLGPVARARCHQIIAEHSPELATLVTHHGAAEPMG